MKPQVEYKIDQKNKIIHRSFCGEIYLQDNIDSWKELFKKVDFSEINGVITDFSNCEFKMKVDEITILLEFLNENLKNLSKIKLAVISVRPEVVVLPTIAQNDFPNLNIMPFSTLEGAKNWILK